MVIFGFYLLIYGCPGNSTIKRSKKGLDVATLQQKTGFDEKEIRNVIYKAHKEGKIRRAERGIYLGACQNDAHHCNFRHICI